jgi:predicted nucleotidyltransferase
MRDGIQNIKQKILPILKEYGITKAGMFGSYASGKTHKKSDVDLLVEIKQKIGLVEFIRLKLALEKKIGRRVDIVEYKAIKPILRKRILEQEVSLL